jgi:predicted RNA-binding protein associated with RNAse of E/G family
MSGVPTGGVMKALAGLPPGSRGALATVVATRGSTPRKAGTHMLILPGEERLVGTVGGGCGEAEVIDAARQVVESGLPQLVRVDLTEDLLSWSPAVCGGVMDVLVEPVAGTPAPVPGEFVHIHYLRPPDRKTLYVQRLLGVFDGALVTLARDLSFDPPLRIGGEVALESGSLALWFTLPGFWHDIGIFHRSDGHRTGIYANILTPPLITHGGDGHRWDTTDLFLDVWIPEDGEPVLLDRDQLRDAEANSWVTGGTARRAEREGLDLLERARSGVWPTAQVMEWTLERALELEDQLLRQGAPERPPGREDQ